MLDKYGNTNNYAPKNAGFVDKTISYPITNIVSKPLYEIGVTPNMVTAFTCVTRLLAMYLLFHRQKRTLVLGMYTLSWLTDALDGLMARKYDMKSELGAKLDLMVDVGTMIPTGIILFHRYYKNDRYRFGIFIGILVLLKALQVIKVKNKNPKHMKKLKPWEVILSKIPLDGETNEWINAVDPGLENVTILAGIYYGLFEIEQPQVKRIMTLRSEMQ